MIKIYKHEMLDELYTYLQEIFSKMPYGFNVTKDKLEESLLDDKDIEGNHKFSDLHTYIYYEDGIKGMIQFGKPRYHYDSGDKIVNPKIGVIRMIYFPEGDYIIADRLLKEANKYFVLHHLEKKYAFYHALGMSCLASHGKVYDYFTDIEMYLLKKGFSIEHENVYYIADLNEYKLVESKGYRVIRESVMGCLETLDLVNDEDVYGRAVIKYLENHTGTRSNKSVYLQLVALSSDSRGKGLGTVFMSLLVEKLKNEGYYYLHTDTDYDNYRAQKYYENLGFYKMGVTKSFYNL